MKAVLFDIDGTILRCQGAGRRSLLKACTEVFGTFGRMEQVDFQGRTDPWILDESLKHLGFPSDLIKEKTEPLKEGYFIHLGEELKQGDALLLPGIVPLLERLSARDDIFIGLLTGNFHESALIKLRQFGLEGYFKFGVFGDDAVFRNDMPGIARSRLVEILGRDIPFTDMVIIGDTIYDIECAKKAGVCSIAVATGWSDREVLIEHKPGHFFEDLQDTDLVMKAIRGCS